MRAVPPQVRARDQRELPRPPIAVASASEAPYLGPWSCTTSPFSRSSPFPPVVGWLLEDHRRCDLHVKVVAELPQLLGRSRVLEESTIDLEGIQFTGPVSIDSLPDASNQRSQLCAVIVRNHLTRSPSLRLAGHAMRGYSLSARRPSSSRQAPVRSRGIRNCPTSPRPGRRGGCGDRAVAGSVKQCAGPDIGSRVADGDQRVSPRPGLRGGRAGSFADVDGGRASSG